MVDQSQAVVPTADDEEAEEADVLGHALAPLGVQCLAAAVPQARRAALMQTRSFVVISKFLPCLSRLSLGLSPSQQ